MYKECETCKCNQNNKCIAIMKEQAPKECPDYEHLLEWGDFPT